MKFKTDRQLYKIRKQHTNEMRRLIKKNLKKEPKRTLGLN